VLLAVTWGLHLKRNESASCAFKLSTIQGTPFVRDSLLKDFLGCSRGPHEELCPANERGEVSKHQNGIYTQICRQMRHSIVYLGSRGTNYAIANESLLRKALLVLADPLLGR
jgi:hypothetical protein